MAGRQLFYTLDGPAADLSLAEGLVLERFHPTVSSLRPADMPEPPPLPLQLFWHLFSRQSYEIYLVRAGGAIVHTSHVITKNPKFAFMGPSDVEIGPCWTDKAYRGRGIYPAVLSRIARDRSGKRLWMFCDEDNSSSRKGIERAGFSFAGAGGKKRGIYRIEETAPR